MKNYLITCGFVRHDIFTHKMEHLYDEGMLSAKFEHYFLYQHYPLNKEENKERLLDTCKKYNINWVDSGHDRGHSHGTNYLIDVINPNNEDNFVGFDPDEYPSTVGWDTAMLDVMNENSDIAIVSLNNSFNINDSPGCVFEYRTAAGHNVAIPTNRPTMMTIAGFKIAWFRQMGGFGQPTTHYGHLESHFWQKLRAHQRKTAILLDYKVTYGIGPDQDHLYAQYKQAQAGFASKEPFEVWLKNRGISCG